VQVLCDRTTYRHLIKSAVRARPFESCGVLFTVAARPGWLVAEMLELPNLAFDRASGFRMSGAVVATWRGRWETAPGRQLGYFHTHGIGSAEPSCHDLRTIRAQQGLHAIADPSGTVRFFAGGAGGPVQATRVVLL
jgi:proteasome lid subunit RPN8/RPN11